MLKQDTRHTVQSILVNYKGYEKEPLSRVCLLLVTLSGEIEELQKRIAILEKQAPAHV